MPLLPPDLNPLRTLLWAKALVSFVSPLSSLENTKLKINQSSIRLLFCLFKNVDAWAQSSGGNSLLTQRRINLRKWLRLWQLWTGICSCAQAYCFNWETSPQQKPQPQNVTTGVKHPGHLVTQKSWHLGPAVAAGLAGAVEMFINCVGLRDVLVLQAPGSSCLPVYRPASPCSHAHTIQNTSAVFYNSQPGKTRTCVIRLEIKRSQCWKLSVPISFPMKAAIKHAHGECILAILRKEGIWTQLFGSQLCPWNKWNCKAVFYQMPRHWQKAVRPEFHIHSLGAWFKPRNLSSGGKWETAPGTAEKWWWRVFVSSSTL